MSPFERGSAVRALGEGRFAIDLPDGWQQGRGAFGGLVLGVLARAVEACERDPARRTRTLTGDIVGPVQPGPAEILVTTLRNGHNQTNFRADLVQGGEVLAHASVISSKPRPSDVATRPVPPARPRWEDAPVIAPMEGGPRFARFYEFRNVGPVPFTAGQEALAGGFVRENERPTKIDVPGVIGLLDAWWPAMFTLSDRPRAGATVCFTAEILCDPATLDPDTRFFVTCRAVADHEGFFVELRELWAGDRLVGLNQQTFALLR